MGAGGGSVPRWLAEQVGPDRLVLATDLDLAQPGLQPLLCPDEHGPAQQRANRLRYVFRSLMAGRRADLATAPPVSARGRVPRTPG